MPKVSELETLASALVGDGKTPDVFFVTDQGAVVTIDTDASRAYSVWVALASRSPRRECALENRTYGVIASIAPETDDPGARLIRVDDFSALTATV